MKRVSNRLKVGDYLFILNMNRVYRIKKILNSTKDDPTYIREKVYSRDGSFGPEKRLHSETLLDSSYLLNKEEVNYYLKLVIFSS